MIIERVRATGADLGIAWDGDADRCFFIDGSGEFCDGDFICALLARAALAKNPGATILYDPRSSRAVPDLVAAEGGRSDLSRVGHAFFKARMREEGAVFGGEVSGHYYFRDFWNADSGTIPALLMLELLSLDGRTLGELMDEFRSQATSSPARSTPRSPTRRRRWRRSPSATPTASRPASTGSRSTTPTGTSTCAPPTPSRCCASTSSRWSRARTWSAKRDEVLGLIRGVSELTPEEALEQAALAGHPPPADPDPVRGRPGQLLPDRGRAADPGRHRAQLGQGARRAAAPARPSAATRSTTSSWSSSPTSTSTTSAWSRSSSSTPAPRWRRSASPPSGSPTSTRTPRPRTASRSS